MSQQGPGGYGGGGPYGPPNGGYPGAPPGGYGPPGAGGPPGYGGPGGYPPGYGGPQQPPYGQPGYGPGGPAPQPPAKKSNALLFVGLGCGLLVLLGVAFGAWAYFGVYRPAKQQIDALQTAATSVVPGVATALNPSGTASPMCAKVAACCRAILERSAGRNATGNCDAFSLLSDDLCAKQYDTFKRQAGIVGATCE